MSEHLKNVRLDPFDSRVLFNLWVRLCMWGKVNDERMVFDSTRFNPTHVGKRANSTLSFQEPPVQPHACGEKIRR